MQYKKIIPSLMVASILASSAGADFIRVEAGAGLWSQSGSGSAVYSSGSDLLPMSGTYTTNGDTQSDFYFWAILKHPVPIVPNFRLEYSTLSDEGKSDGSMSGYENFTNSPTNIDVQQIEVIPYYNLLDNTFWLTFDVGLDIRYMSSDVELNGLSVATPMGSVALSTQSYSNSEDIFLPMLYLRTRAQLPVTGLGVEADIKYTTDGDSTVYDVRAKVDYTFDITPVIQPGIELGYRIQKFDIDTDDTKSNIDYSGVYAGVMLRF